MATDISLGCDCGKLQGRAVGVSSAIGTRAVCYCDDCQAFARYLGRSDVLDANGGTDCFLLPPSHLRITSGHEHLRVMRLSDRGLARWYAACCRAPIATTPTSTRVPFASVAVTFMAPERNGRSLDGVLGPPAARVRAKFAVGSPPPGAHATAPLGFFARVLRWLVPAWLTGKQRPSPFFDADGQLVAQPSVLSPPERERLRA